MENINLSMQAFNDNGFAIIDSVFSNDEVQKMIALIDNASADNPSFRKTKDLFAIRHFFQEVPDVVDQLFTVRFLQMVKCIFGSNYFVVKSIYFDKPATSNWFVPYHQDLTISVDKKIELQGFESWTVKQNYFAVQPPVTILQNNFTVRVNLDNTDANNGALKVIPTSHTKGIIKPEFFKPAIEKEVVCEVEKGGAMLMKPLLLHASGKTMNAKRRRVIHIEFSKSNLPDGLRWAEYMAINSSN